MTSAAAMDSAIADFDVRFENTFGRVPTVRVQSPGRINLIGEHIDYLDGWVMPAAIDRQLTILAAPNERNEIRAWSAALPGTPASISLTALERRSAPEESWLNYLIGVLAGYRETKASIPGFDAAIFSDLPSGAGLSSSAALETATALTVEALTGTERGVVERALICQKAEHEFAGVPCGIMDQLAVGASRAGHAILIDCRDLILRTIPIPADIAIVVADTRVTHALGDGEYRVRREQCESALAILDAGSFRDLNLSAVDAMRDKLGDVRYRRAHHAVTEMQRVLEFAEAMETSALDRVGPIMRAGHNSLRDDFEVSCDELDFLVESAHDFGSGRGLIGSRMTGGGFGGSTVSLVARETADAFARHLQAAFRKAFGREIEPFVTSAAEGAGINSYPNNP